MADGLEKLILTGAARENYLQTIKDGLSLAGRTLEKLKEFDSFGEGRFLDSYLKGRCGLLCECDVSYGDRKRVACLSNWAANPAILKRAAAPIHPAGYKPSIFDRGQQKPVLIDVSEFVHDPQGVPIASFVSLYFRDKMLDERFVQPQCGIATLAFEPICIVGKREVGGICPAGYWLCNSQSDIIKSASQIADCVSEDEIQILAGLMQRLKLEFNSSFPLIDFGVESIKVCSEKAALKDFKVRNVFACPIELSASI